MPTSRPDPSDYKSYFDKYISLVPDGAIVETLRAQTPGFAALYRGIDDEKALHRYAPGKWSIKEMMGHLIDTERIFAYRGLAVSRGEQQPLPSFEQDDYVAGANFDARRWSDLLDEFATVRAATLSLFSFLTDEMLARRGTASNGPITGLAAGFIIAGHERYHAQLLKERYL